VVKIVLPVTASLLALVAVALYLVWICKLRGRATSLLRMWYPCRITLTGTSKGYILIDISVRPTSKQGCPEESDGWILDHDT